MDSISLIFKSTVIKQNRKAVKYHIHITLIFKLIKSTPVFQQGRCGWEIGDSNPG